jgi:hypothetical protein
MTLRKKLFTFFLWWAVIGFSLWVGGTLFNMTVIVGFSVMLAKEYILIIPLPYQLHSWLN